MICLTSDYNHNKYKDNLCFFRCLTCHRHPKLFSSPKQFEIQVNLYCQQFNSHFDIDCSDGIDLNMLPELEKFFKININVFSLHDDGTSLAIFKSLCRYKDLMYLNLYENHFSYVKNIKLYCHKYQCPSCKKLFKTNRNCNRHTTNCNHSTTYQFPGGFYEENKTIFEELEEQGINVDPEDQFFEYFLCFNFEAMQKKIVVENADLNTVHTAQHIPISVSIASNVPDFEKPHCIVETNEEKLVSEMLLYMSNIQSLSEAFVANAGAFQFF